MDHIPNLFITGNGHRCILTTQSIVAAMPIDGSHPQSIVADHGRRWILPTIYYAVAGNICQLSPSSNILSPKDKINRWARLTTYWLCSRQCISVDTRTTHSAEHSDVSIVRQQQYDVLRGQE